MEWLSMKPGANDPKLLVIGYGNELRGDDAVGPLVARAVDDWRMPGVRALALHQLTPELAEELAVAERVVFVDASVDPDADEVRMEELRPEESSVRLGHCSDPRWLLALTLKLYGRSPPAFLLTITAVNMAHGSGLSPRTQRGMEEALRTISGLI
jgi:hydrogenase maturation protease